MGRALGGPWEEPPGPVRYSGSLQALTTVPQAAEGGTPVISSQMKPEAGTCHAKAAASPSL